MHISFSTTQDDIVPLRAFSGPFTLYKLRHNFHVHFCGLAKAMPIEFDTMIRWMKLSVSLNGMVSVGGKRLGLERKLFSEVLRVTVQLLSVAKGHHCPGQAQVRNYCKYRASCRSLSMWHQLWKHNFLLLESCATLCSSVE